MKTPDVLSLRALNRALLARQMLIERRAMSATAALMHLVGMQAQSPFPPYFGLWTRLENFRAEELSELIENRSSLLPRAPWRRRTLSAGT
jgi:hypothetical protein